MTYIMCSNNLLVCVHYHVQRGSAKHSVMDDFTFLWETNFRTSRNSKLLDPQTWNIAQLITSPASSHAPSFMKIRPLEAARRMREIYAYRDNACLHFFPSFLRSRTGHTAWPIFTRNGSFDAVPRKEVPSRVSTLTKFSKGVIFPKNP